MTATACARKIIKVKIYSTYQPSRYVLNVKRERVEVTS